MSWLGIKFLPAFDEWCRASMGMSTSICKYGRASYDLGVRLSLAFVRFDIYIYIYIFIWYKNIKKNISMYIFK
jgi:hypothetical protein